MKIKWNLRVVFLLGTLIASLFLLPGILANHGILLLWGDYNYQQIPFYLSAHEAIRAGHFFWSMTTDLGVDFIGSYSFYLLGSPFFWVSLLFPSAAVPYIMGPFLAIKFGLATMAAYAYIRTFTLDRFAAIGGLLYAFSGFALTTMYWNHFMEPLILFPFLLLALDKLVLEGKKGVFLAMVFLSAIVNYVFFVSAMVFLLLYLVANIGTKRYQLKGKGYAQGILEFILGVGLSLAILLPSVSAAMGSGRTGFDSNPVSLLAWLQKSFLYQNDVLWHVVTSLFYPPEVQGALALVTNSYMWAGISLGLPVVGIVGVIAFLKGRRKKNPLEQERRNRGQGFISIALLLSMVFMAIPLLNSSFSLFAGEYYARWFYMPVLLMALATAIALAKFKLSDWWFGLKLATLPTLLIAGFYAVAPLRIAGKIQIGRYDYAMAFRFWSMTLIALGSLLLVYLLLRYREQLGRGWIRWVLLTLSLAIVLHGVYFIQMGSQVDRKNYGDLHRLIKEGSTYFGDQEFYRIDYLSPHSNLSLYLNTPGIKSFTSLISPRVLPLYESLGNPRTGVTTSQKPAQAAYRILTSVRYYLGEVGEEVAIQGFTPKGKVGRFTRYENSNYLQLGLFYSQYMTREEFEALPQKDRDVALVKALVLSPEQISRYGTSVIPIPKESLQDNSYDSLMTEVTYKKEKESQNLRYEGNTLTLDMKSDIPGMIFISVPYSEGWKASLNGKTVKVEEVSLGLMAIPAEAGENHLRMSYQPILATFGLIATGIFFGVSILYLITPVKRKGKKQ